MGAKRISRCYGRNAATKTLITIDATMRPASPSTSMPPRSAMSVSRGWDLPRAPAIRGRMT